MLELAGRRPRGRAKRRSKDVRMTRRILGGGSSLAVAAAVEKERLSFLNPFWSLEESEVIHFLPFK